MTMTDLRPVWSKPVSIDDIPEQGLHVDLTADDAVRAEIAKIANLRDLPALAASFDITREGADAIRVDGEVFATVGQNCVVTLEPIESALNEPVSLLFTTKAAGSMADDEGKITVDFDGADQLEPMRDGVVDLGAIATEFFLLGIDPYPRKEGAVFEAPKIAEDPATHPFAALQALKKADGGDKT
jgi:uncharacterized metal-binding protein YceD (DUF177 family)